MGSTEAARIDAAAVSAAAREYETAADIVDRVLRDQLAGMRFGAAAAGRAHVAGGERVAAAVDELSVVVRQWSRAAAEIAGALQVSAQSYREADASSAGRIG